MRKLLVGLALLALPCLAHAATLIGDQESAAIGPRTINARGLLSVTAISDTLGPVLIGGCRKSLLCASWTGDSTTIVVETSVDRSNWSAVSLGTLTNLGTAATYGLYFSRVIEPTSANVTASAGGTVGGTSNLAIGRYVRLRATYNGVTGNLTNFTASISCAH